MHLSAGPSPVPAAGAAAHPAPAVLWARALLRTQLASLGEWQSRGPAEEPDPELAPALQLHPTCFLGQTSRPGTRGKTCLLPLQDPWWPCGSRVASGLQWCRGQPLRELGVHCMVKK